MSSFGHNNVSLTNAWKINGNTEHRPSVFMGSNEKKKSFSGRFVTQFPFNIFLKRRRLF